MNIKRAIVDLSSVVWTALLNGVDKEFGRKEVTEKGKEVTVNSASYGYETAIQYLSRALEELGIVPRNVILVMEGKNSKANRQAIHADYKAGRDKTPGQYEEFNKCKQQVIDAFLAAGAQMCWQDGGVEADDVIGYLATHLKGERWIISGDKDLAVLVGGDIHQYRAGIKDQNPLGPFDHRWITTYLALVGDSGDKIPGAKNFGKGAMEKMLIAFGDDGLELMDGLIRNKQLKRLEEDVPTLKELQKIIDDAQGVYMCYELARLHIERVNTVKRPLEWKVGMVRTRTGDEDERLRKFGGAVKLVSAENYAEAMRWAKAHIERSPEVALDIETSTPPESDDWLEQLGKSEDRTPVDVFGSELTGLGMTFGPNMQFTLYLTHDHAEVPGCTNLTIEQVRDFVNLVPRDKITWVHNASFELPICYMEWGQDWVDDQEYRGFLRNVRDTAIASSYADENRSRGLKNLSKTVLGYEQTNYDQVTTKTMPKSVWDGSGKLLHSWREQIPQPTGKFGTVMQGTGTYNMIDTTNHYGDPVQVKGTEIMVEVEGSEIIEYVDGPEMVKVQFKMNQLTADEVLDYGADDTICTAALASHFRTIMEIEDTWHIFDDIETFPAYLTALAFVQGTDFSLEEMRAMEKDDDKAYDEAWPKLRDYLIAVGFDGTVCPTMVDEKPPKEKADDEEADGPILYFQSSPYIKQAFAIVAGVEMEKTSVRTPDKLAKLMRQQSESLDEDLQGRVLLLADAVAAKNISAINDLLKQTFKGEPTLDLNSPKKVAKLLYDVIGIPVRVINDVTPIERIHNRDLDEAIRKFKQKRAGKDIDLTEDDLKWVRKKASGDKTSVEMAVAFDADIVQGAAKDALKALGVMKKVLTRRQLFYANYWKLPHWKDGKIHASANQCAAVTRRYSYSNPNLQQLPKKGEAVRFRAGFKPHHKDAVIDSIDYTGQELRLSAERSQDKNLLACYVGDNLKDVHSITAAGALKLKWGAQMVKELFEKHGEELDDTAEGVYELFLRLRNLGKSDPIGKKADDQRKDAKNVNFSAQNGAKAAKVSETNIIPYADAQMFLDARAAMFPDVDKAAERAAAFAKKNGYSMTMMGARRHLAEAIRSSENGAADRAARQAWNFEIQGSAGEQTKIGMTRMWKRGLFFRYDARFIAQVHDELVSSVHRDHAVDFLREKNECMTGPYAEMKVPILASISIGPDFANQTECGDWWIPERINGALNDIFQEKAAA